MTLTDFHAPIIIGACRVCSWKALVQGGLCIDCREVAIWSAENRLNCAILHRDSPARKADLA